MEYKDLIRKKIGRIADRLLTVLFSICILIIVFISFQVTTFTTFHIPSDSMYPALQAGDNVLVNKWIMYRAQNETYMCRSAENVVKSLCFNKLCAVG